MLTFPYDSRERRLRAFVREAVTLHLYVNDVTPEATTTAAAFVEPDASIGYEPKPLMRAAWRFEPSGPAVRAVSDGARWTFTRGKATIRGQFALDAEGMLCWSERFGYWNEGTLGPGEQAGVMAIPKVWVDEAFEVLRTNDELHVPIAIVSKDLQEEVPA